MKIHLRLMKGWSEKVPQKHRQWCDYCMTLGKMVNLFQAPHGGIYCDEVHMPNIISLTLGSPKVVK